VKLLKKAQTYFRRPELSSVIYRKAPRMMEQAGSSRSKRA